MGISKRLFALLKKNHINAGELSERVGVSPSTIYSMLSRDSNRIDIDLIIKISHALGVTADELLSDNIQEYDDNKSVHPNHKVHIELLEHDPNLGQLLDAAAGCTDEQIKIAINMLNQFKVPFMNEED